MSIFIMLQTSQQPAFRTGFMLICYEVFMGHAKCNGQETINVTMTNAW